MMNVGKLREMLEAYEDDTPVIFSAGEMGNEFYIENVVSNKADIMVTDEIVEDNDLDKDEIIVLIDGEKA
jgi:hypothetical protein